MDVVSQGDKAVPVYYLPVAIAQLLEMCSFCGEVSPA